MPKCVICKCSSDKSLRRAMHRFPDDVNLKKAWIDALFLIHDFLSLKYIYLCSDHFQENDFILQPSGFRILKPDAVPFQAIVKSESDQKPSSSPDVSRVSKKKKLDSPDSKSPVICEFRKHGQMQSKEFDASSCTSESFECSQSFIPLSRGRMKGTSGTITAPEVQEHVEVPKKKVRLKRKYVGDLSNDILRSPKKAKAAFSLAKTEIKQLNMIIRTLQQENRRLKLKYSDLKSLLSR